MSGRRGELRGVSWSVAWSFVAAVTATLGAGGCGGDNLEGQHVDAGVDATTPVLDGAAPPDSGPFDGGVLVPCSGDGLSLCRAGRCSLSGAASSLPPGAVVTLADEPLDPALTTDALLPYQCDVQLPPGVDAGAAAFTLRMDVAAGTVVPAAGAVMFSWVSPVATAVATSGIAAGAVQGVLTASGIYGATAARVTPTLTTQLGTDPRSSADLPSLVRNVSGGQMAASFFDGTRLYLGSGGRVLIYAHGIPADPTVAPDVVLGQPTLDSSVAGISASIFEQYVAGIWSDGTKLVVSTGNRTLIWNAVPTVSFTPADLVLGQPDFSIDSANNGGLSAASQWEPFGVDSDGTRLAVADFANNRVLTWSTFPQTLNQPATGVVGQGTFAGGLSYSGLAQLYFPISVAFDGAGLYVASSYTGPVHVADATGVNPAEDFQPLVWNVSAAPNSSYRTTGVTFTRSGALAVMNQNAWRIAMWRTPPTATTPMDFAVGQPDIRMTNEHPLSASAFAEPANYQAQIRGANGKFLVTDSARALLWDPEPTYAFEPASRVFGQPGFTTDDVGIDYRNLSASTLGYPADVAAAGGMIAVADRGNNRVLVYSSAGIASGGAAAVVLGQPDFASFVPDLDQSTPSAARMSGPGGVALDGQHLIVADTENHRVLVWNTVPTVSGAAADLVLGQADFTGKRPNRGRADADGDGHSDADADGFFAPTGVASDGTHLFVADRINSRVLEWTAFPTANGQPADVVLGQADMHGTGVNAGAGPDTVSAAAFDLPSGLALASDTLYVADTENNRVVRIDHATSAPVASAWFGQANGTSVSAENFGLQGAYNSGAQVTVPTSAATVLRPRGVVLAGGRVYISEGDSQRVHVFDAATLASQAILGQTDPTSAVPNANGIGAGTLSAPAGVGSDGQRLYVADSANHRVLGWSLATAPGSGAAADLVLGQPTFVNSEFNRSVAPSAGGAARPRGLAVNGGQLFTAEADHNRVLVTSAPPVAGGGTVRIYGQPSETVYLPNSGGAPGAGTLDSPRGVFVDAAHVLIADTSNNRVLVFDRPSGSTVANLVLGQTDFVSAQANAGGAASASTLAAPQGVYSDGTRLYVADTGNNRILVWNRFPTASAQPADLVVGQADFAGLLVNGGAQTAAASLSSPTAVDVVGGHLYIADSGNNRVVGFSQLPATNGASADVILGQPDLTTRTPGSVITDLTTLAGPVQIVDDGEELYVCDRDLARVVAYSLDPTGKPLVPRLAFPLGITTLSGPDGLAVERTPLFTSRLYVASTNANVVDVFEQISRLAGP
jgi:sugar lactone lactonase YvrE